MTVKADLHVHTRFSFDSLTTLGDVDRWMRRRGLDVVAITDHNTIEGARALKRLHPRRIIVGEEVRTRYGEICGLFLQEPVPPGQDPGKTALHIRQQGGLVYVPHPMDRIRHSALDFAALIEIIELVDVIETLNARVTVMVDNTHAGAVARAYGIAQGAGSDAHQGYEIGHAYVEMPDFTDAGSFLQSLAQAQVHGHTSSPLVHVGSTYAKVAKELMALSPFVK